MRKPNLVQMVVGSLAAGVLMSSSPSWADDTSQLKSQVQALQNQVSQLESQLANKQQVTSVPMDQWEDPLAQMMLMQEQMQRNMRQDFADTGVFTPKMDMKQTDNKYIITMDIPGMDKNKINVQIKEGMLIISGERRSEEIQNNKNNQYYRQERSFGTFTQAIPLPDDAKKDQIDANYKNGVLTVTVGRAKKADNQSQSGRITVN